MSHIVCNVYRCQQNGKFTVDVQHKDNKNETQGEDRKVGELNASLMSDGDSAKLDFKLQRDNEV